MQLIGIWLYSRYDYKKEYNNFQQTKTKIKVISLVNTWMSNWASTLLDGTYHEPIEFRI